MGLKLEKQSKNALPSLAKVWSPLFFELHRGNKIGVVI
jgi:hypothetical protein